MDEQEREVDLTTMLMDQATDDPSVLLTPAEMAEAKRAAQSVHVLDVDRWARRRGEELADYWEQIDASNHDKYSPNPTPVTDAHEALFSVSPEFAENPAEQGRAAWFKQLMDTDDYRRLHAQTCLDTDASALAAKSIVDNWLEYAAKNPEPEDGDPAPGSDDESLQQTINRMRSTKNALQQASETIDQAREISYGLGAGSDGDKLDKQVIAKYFQQVRNDQFLRRLMAMAGRMRRLCQTLQRTKTQHGRDDVVGVELAGDIGRLLPSELAQLESEIPEIELLAIDRIARGQALCRQYRGIEPLARGPIVVLVDESASMKGEPIIAAKGMALALVWLAKQQKRWISLVSFSHEGAYERTIFIPDHLDHSELINWLSHFFSGGTHLPLNELMEDWGGMPKGKTDVIIVTDAECEVNDATRERYLRWSKDEQVRTYGVVLGQDEPGILGDISTRCWCVPELSLDSPAVEGILSI